MTIRAAICREVGLPLTIEPVLLRAPTGREVAVDLAACAICHSDIAFIDGAWATALPAIFGHEATGTVAAVGNGVADIAPGDRVVITLIRACGACPACARGRPVLCAGDDVMAPPITRPDGAPIAQGMETGAFAEQVLVDASQVVKLPDDMPLDLAALLGCGALTGHGAVNNTARVPADASVVVVGAGGVGMNVIQAARLAEARPIIAVDSVRAKGDQARLFGASHALNSRDDDVVAEIRRLTGGRGADYVFVAVGIASLMEQGLDLLAPGGALVVVGMPPDNATVRFDPSMLAARSLRILGSKMGDANPAADIPRLIAHHRAGRLALEPLISRRFRFDRINDALDDARRGDALRNIVIFDA